MVSVIIPYHHDEKLLMEVVHNLCEGLNPNDFEIIIVNDGSVSPDGRFKPLDFQTFKYRNVAVVNNSIQRGVGYSFDRGVEASQGDIIVLQGADVFARKRSWLKDVYSACTVNPNTIGCSACVGLTPEDHNIDREGRTVRYGADLLFQCSVEDLPQNSPLREQPDYRAIFEAKWRFKKGWGEQMGRPFQIPCALGAFYWASKEYYQKIGGWDTEANVRFQGHQFWGKLESYISLKSWLYGGGVTLYPNIETGHIFGRIPHEDRFKHRANRPEYYHWNGLFMAHTMIMDDKMRDKIVNFVKPNLNYNLAQKYIRQYQSNVLKIKNRNKLGFVNSLDYFCKKFNIKIK